MAAARIPEPDKATGHELTDRDEVVDPALSDTDRFILEALERLDAADTKASQLEHALEHSRDIGAAVGVLMALRRVTQQEAFELLRRASQDQNRKLYNLALDVIDTGDLAPRRL